MKTIIITGGTDGLGKEIMKQLYTTHTVIVLARDIEKINNIQQEYNIDAYVCDVTDAVQVEKTFQSIASKYSSIDGLINNVGLWIEGELADNTYKHIADTVQTNVTSYIYCTKAVLEYINKQDGFIININSQAGLYGKAKRSVYNATKRAITGFTKALQEEYAGTGLKIMGVYPGKMNTGFFKKQGIEKTTNDALHPQEVAKIITYVIETGVMIPEIGMHPSGFKTIE